MKPTPDLILKNGRISTLDRQRPEAKEVVVSGGHIVGIDNASEYQAGPQTKVGGGWSEFQFAEKCMLGSRGLLDVGCECFAF